MTQQQRQRLKERRLKLFEKQFVRPIYEEIRRPMVRTAELLRERGLDAAIKYAESVVIIDGVSKTIRDIYTTVGVWAAKKTLAEIRASAKIETKAGFGFNERWIEDILNYFRIFLLSKAVLPISDTTRKDILEVLTTGIKEGWGIDRMAFELERVDMPLSRARTIVRTEIAKAQFYGTELGRKDSPFETVEKWIAASDHRTRHSHREVNGTVIETGQKFKVARYRKNVIIGYDMMIGPGDPDASPENVINCRCTKSIRAKRDTNGRPIKKNIANSEISLTLT
jgi:uncharacterized protein with gpF-like domain